MAPKRRGRGRPHAVRVEAPTADVPDIEENVVDDLNDTFPTLYPTRRHRRQLPIPPPTVIAPHDHLPYNNDETALKQINIRNLQDNVDLTQRTRPTREPTHATIPHVTENTELVHMAGHFPHLLNSKTMHFYNLPFAFDTFRKSQRKGIFFSDIIKYLEDNHLPINKRRQNSIIAEAENYLLFSTLLFHFTVKSHKTVEHKLALCIPLELSDGIFELYHSGLMTSHQGLTRTYYKIRQDFFIMNLYKYLHLYIMSI